MKNTVIALTVLMLASTLATAQSTPSLINYQGRLTDAAGQPLPTADYPLTFNIYDQPTDGTPVWGPLHFDIESGATLSQGHKYKVPVVQGYFNVMLGEVDINGASILSAFDGPNRYLEITIIPGTPILPRQQILSAPYAVRAKYADQATQALAGGGEIGDIVMSSLTEAQFNTQRSAGEWVLCDGRDVTGTEYEAVAGAATVPDLRGRFPIAAGQGVGLTDRALGAFDGEEMHTLTLGEIPFHQHHYWHFNDGGSSNNQWGVGSGDDTGQPYAALTDEDDPTSWATLADHGLEYPPPGNDESHNNMPPFFVVNFFIRVN